jgi:hypothetical protein
MSGPSIVVIVCNGARVRLLLSAADSRPTTTVINTCIWPTGGGLY